MMVIWWFIGSTIINGIDDAKSYSLRMVYDLGQLISEVILNHLTSLQKLDFLEARQGSLIPYKCRGNMDQKHKHLV